MPGCRIDHLTVTAPTLEAGVAYVEERLGVAMQPGGEHPRMGTHNALLRLGEGLFLEVIAVDPAAPAPGRPRWFGLDLPGGRPGLSAWVARTDDIAATAAASPVPLGRVQPMSRGALNWQISIPDDGSTPLGGILPMLIQWEPGRHPAHSLPDAGCRLASLHGRHPQATLACDALRAIGFTGEYAVSAPSRDTPPGLVAHIQTPHGLRQL